MSASTLFPQHWLEDTPEDEHEEGGCEDEAAIDEKIID